MANLNCKCGGKFKSIDSVIAVPYKYNITVYETIRILEGYASWSCNKCSKLQQQKLRVANK